MAAFADAIWPYHDLGGAVSFPMRATIEEAGQTFLLGTPVQINSSDGGVQAWDGTTLTAGIAGFASQPGQNLGTTGAGADFGGRERGGAPTAQDFPRSSMSSGTKPSVRGTWVCSRC